MMRESFKTESIDWREGKELNLGWGYRDSIKWDQRTETPCWGKEIGCHPCPATPMSTARGHRRSVLTASWRGEPVREESEGKG